MYIRLSVCSLVVNMFNRKELFLKLEKDLSGRATKNEFYLLRLPLVRVCTENAHFPPDQIVSYVTQRCSCHPHSKVNTTKLFYKKKYFATK